MTGLRRGLLASGALALVVAVVAGSSRASPNDDAGVPFVTFAQATAGSDYALACRQLARPALRGRTRRACAEQLRAQAAEDPAGIRRLASTRVVKVRVKPGRARVTVQTTFADLEPRATGTAVVEDGTWRIREPPSGEHVGSLFLYTVPSESMVPTLHVGDTALVDQDAYRHAKPAIGDIVVFHPPAGAQSDKQCAKRPPKRQACATATRRNADAKFIKRIVAGPGDRISIRDGHVIRNGRRVAEPFVSPCGRDGQGCDFPRTFTVAPGRWYVLGDNRGSSDDSRYWGPVARRALVGRVGRIIPRASGR